MATKITGLNARFYIGGFDLSADVSALDNVAGSIHPLDVTGIQALAHERLGGQREGALDFSLFFDTGAGQEHAALSGLPTADVIASAFLANAAGAQAVGSPCCSINSKQVNYDWTRGTDGSLTGKVSCQSSGFGLEWGEALTAGLRTDSAATVGAFFDDGAGTAFGGQAYFQLIAFAGTSVTIDIQSATTSGGSYATTGLTSSALTAIGAQRVAVSNATTINEFLKVVTTGTFSNAVFAVHFSRNLVAGVVF
jgi:hypothetical protein